MGYNDGGGSPQDLIAQTWIMYSIAIALFLTRIYARYVRLGFKWQIEDYLMVLAVAWYTTMCVTNIAIITGGGSSLYLPGQYETFTAADIAARVKGSKIEFASEMCMLNTMYTLKACMLIIYFQLTSNLSQQKWMKLSAGYTFLGWLATVLVLFFNCHPFTGYWTLPPPQEECASYFRYEVTQAVFNVSSDLTMICVILPMLFRIRMPWKTKLPLLFIFSMGLVVVICACTSKYFTFKDIWDDSYQFWYLREASIAMYTTNLPYVWSLARQTFRVLRSTESDTSGRLPYAGPSHLSNLQSKTGGQSRRDKYNNLDTVNGSGALERTESEEHIIEMKGMQGMEMRPDGSETVSWAQSDGVGSGNEGLKGAIQKTVEVTVKNDEI
ncbi:uncharacterized protein LY89DRAFT_601132 [Mollisia scopiformis]|uniref:Rhodopsin domain-containing protein n=1 Tax=Mollisia scopiformis TaxID=149040 RepID=A0A132B6Z4_MOLSC|nr:uncharacterized protein LY89DRAFT_601132 [Mollisia scopiformis]KUJ07447.1 hypothetical protein LY89DRAFT_601132 [Mollisia scopiformis]